MSLRTQSNNKNCILKNEKTFKGFNPYFILASSKGVLAKNADPDQVSHIVASDLGLHYFASCSAIFQQKYLI